MPAGPTWVCTLLALQQCCCNQACPSGDLYSRCMPVTLVFMFACIPFSAQALLPALWPGH